MSQSIDVDNNGSVRILTINNPTKRNAFSSDMGAQLENRLEEADEEATIRAVVITGVGNEAFSSGHDLAEVVKDPVTAGDPVANAGFTKPSRMATPVIGAINGVAYAAGFILALNCDMRVAGKNATFCAVGAKIGLVPVGGQLSRLLSIVSYPVAFNMLATAAPVNVMDMQQYGFLAEVCETSETLRKAVKLAKEVAQVSPSVVQAIKAGLTTTLNHGMSKGLETEVQLAALVRELPDGGEGVNSFLERRSARYPDSPNFLTKELLRIIAI